MAKQPFKSTSTRLSSGKATKQKAKSGAKSINAPDKDKLRLDMKALRKLVKSNANDSTAKEMTRAFLGVALEAVKTAEEAYEKNPHAHNSYALNGLMNQARELAADLRQLETIDDNRKQEVSEAVHTVMRNLGFQIAQHINSIKISADSIPVKYRGNVADTATHSGRALSRLMAELTNNLTEELTKGM